MGPPKTKTTNSKVEAALEKKAVVEAKKNAEKARQAEAEESAAWAVGSNQRGASRAAADAEKAAERLRREADKKKANEEDEAANAGVAKPKKVKKKGDDVSALLMAGLTSKEGKKKPVKKAEPTKDEQLRKAQAEALDKKARAKGIVMQDDRALLVENNNRNHADDLDATGIDDAIAVLGGGNKVESKNLKVLYAAFEEKTMPVLRAETPGLKLSQYKERCFALWQKAPENPNNPR